MSGVFLSYSRADRALAEQVIHGLRALDVDVWWDEDMPGVDWQDELARQINELAAVIVLWTPASTASKNVKDEARLGQHTEKLVNALCGVTAPPFPFDRVNGLPLDGWTGREPHRGWTRLVKTVEDHLALAGAAKPGELSSALAAREQAIRTRREALAAAEEAYQVAKAEEEATASLDDEAERALEAAEELLKRVVEVRASGAVLRAAQEDVEAARSAEAQASAARKTSAASLARAARGMRRAKDELDRSFGDATYAASHVPAARPAPPADAAEQPATPAPEPTPAPEATPKPVLAPTPVSPAPPEAVPPQADAATDHAALRTTADGAPPRPASPPAAGRDWRDLSRNPLAWVVVLGGGAIFWLTLIVIAAVLSPPAPPADLSAIFDKNLHDSCVTTASAKVGASLADTYCSCVVTQLDQLPLQQREALTSTSDQLIQAMTTCNAQTAGATTSAAPQP